MATGNNQRLLKISDIRLTEPCGNTGLRQIAAEILQVPASAVADLSIHKLSIDARRKPDVRFVYTLIVSLGKEFSTIANNAQKTHNVTVYVPPEAYEFPFSGIENPPDPPVIVGTGPAGLFAALCLAEAGVKCIILERGAKVEKRTEDVERFWSGGGLQESSNVQFGEGGAGTFSDGKLNTGNKDKRIKYVLERLFEFGAPEDILYLAKPHIGTDKLRLVVKSIRERLIELGCDIRFGHKLSDIDISGGALRGLTVEGAETYSIKTSTLILAPGNSARDTFEMLHRRGVKITPKEFSVGVRIEHLQRDIDLAQYGAAKHKTKLPAADYKLVTHLPREENEKSPLKPAQSLAERSPRQRSVYTFCVCPGGLVVAAASERECLVTNGMSHYARDAENINGALLVTVTPEDFGNSPLDGIAFQRKLEHDAFIAGGSNYNAPAQFVGDFLEKRASDGRGFAVTPTYLPGVSFCNLWDVLPEFVCQAICASLPEFSRRITGFADPRAVLTAVESRSSCPVRIKRNDFEAEGIIGIFPCGEGAGYAGGIMSAATDGIKCAEAVAKKLGATICEALPQFPFQREI